MLYVLTYNHPHKKTQDLLFKLKLYNYKKITVVSTLWVKEKLHSIISLLGIFDIYPDVLTEKLGMEYIELDSLDNFLH